MWSEHTQISYMQMKKTYPVDMQTDDEWRENVRMSFKTPCKYAKEFENNCNPRLLSKPPQTSQEMGHGCTTDKLISTLLHIKIHI